MRARIREAMRQGIALRQRCMEEMEDSLLDAAVLMADALRQGAKVLACGNGGSAADAQHFAAELVNRFQMNRPGLAAIALTHDASVITSIANDFDFADVFSRQVEALGRSGDVLLAISTSGRSPNVLAAMESARHIGMSCVALCGGDGGAMASHEAVRVCLRVPHASTPRIQEMHITSLHIVCDLIDHILFGDAA